ncbi:MAG: efflux RND transporter periplasmic adaptor subunit [Limisphaerales bacterium]
MAMAKTRSGKTALILVVVVLAVLLLGALGTWGYLRNRQVALTVQTEKAQVRNLTELVMATGRIQPVTKVVINPEVSGEIVELPVREGQLVSKGDVLVRIRPDPYEASRNSAEAAYRSSLANIELAKAELEKSKIECERFTQLAGAGLISDSEFLSARTSLEVAQARFETSRHQADQTKAALARAEEDLTKTTIVAPIDGTVTNLRSERGERVVGTAMMAGTEIMTVSDLDEMEARIEVGEIDVVLVKVGQRARLEVDAFRDRKFTGRVTEIANAARTQGMNTQQEATKFEVRIRVEEKESFRPGMSVTAEVETRYRTNVLAVPVQCVTTRLPKEAKEEAARLRKRAAEAGPDAGEAESGSAAAKRGAVQAPKAIEVVFAVRSGKAVMLPVTRGISDETHTEITEGLTEGEEVVSGGYKAINKDLEDGKPVKVDNAVLPFRLRSEEKKP